MFALLAIWNLSGVTTAAWSYLLIDSIVFVPAYAAFCCALALRVADALSNQNAAATTDRERWALIALGCPVLALVLVDLAENALGLGRLGRNGFLIAAIATGISLLALWKVGRLQALAGEVGKLGLLVTLGLATIMLVSGWRADECAVDGAGTTVEWLGRGGCAAHQAKQFLLLVVFLLIVLGSCAWLFGMVLETSDRTQAIRDDRSRLRAAIGDILLRSRYVLLALIFLAVLTVRLDQGRDVVYAMAASPFGIGTPFWLVLGALTAFAALAASTGLLAYSCWLWTHSVCQLRPRADGAAARPGCRVSAGRGSLCP